MKPEVSENKKSLVMRVGRFQAQIDPIDCALSLTTTHSLPQSKASALLEKLEESKANAREINEIYQPEPIEWRMADTPWMRKMEFKESGNQDLTIESFKAFFEDLSAKYCSHYSSDNFKQLFQTHITTFDALKDKLAERARSVNSAQQEATALQNSITFKFDEVKNQQDRIREKIDNIKARIKSITSPYPDDKVLGLFLDELTQRVKGRSTLMASVKTRNDSAVQFEQQMRQSVTRLPSVDDRTKRNADQFIREAKPKLQDLLAQTQQLRFEDP